MNIEHTTSQELWLWQHSNSPSLYFSDALKMILENLLFVFQIIFAWLSKTPPTLSQPKPARNMWAGARLSDNWWKANKEASSWIITFVDQWLNCNNIRRYCKDNGGGLAFLSLIQVLCIKCVNATQGWEDHNPHSSWEMHAWCVREATEN